MDRSVCSALVLWAVCCVGAALAGCAAARAGDIAPRAGDEIMVCGRLVHTGGAPVVLWTDPGGYDAYRVERRFVPLEQADWKAPGAGSAGPATPNRYGLRRAALSTEDLERVRGGTWDLPTLQRVVDQFVIHYDVCGTSRQCFRVLHDVRGLSVHFMLDVDGTIYQTLDLKERAWHATTSNDRSIGIEIANIGAYSVPEGFGTNGGAIQPLPAPLNSWYAFDAFGAYLTLPPWMGDGGIRTTGFVARPSRSGPIVGTIQGERLAMFDLTPQQYDSLIRLTATLCAVFPNLPCDFPRDAAGDPLTTKLDDTALANYRGLLGHYHIQANKTDPGPAFDWQRVVEGARLERRR